MGGATPTYDEIRRLSSQLRKETKVKARRELGKTLHDKLKNEDVLRKLSLEATPQRSNWPDEDSVTAKRCRALSVVWTSVLQGAIHVAQSIVAGKKVKVTEHDIILPYQLLIACNKSKDLLEDQSVAIPIISKKMVRTLLKYCLEFLTDDEVVQVAGLQLLDMLSFLCSTGDYVGHFKYHLDFANILDELSIHLTPEAEEDSREHFCKAAKSLDNLFATTRSLGIEMHLFINDTLGMIAAWCKSYLEGGYDQRKRLRPQAPALSHLYATVTNMLSAHPDHCIGPMKRYGRYILRYCKKCYPNAKSPSKEALNSYLMAHIFLGQFAGRVQGRVAGHMGDLGKASLTPELVDQLLELVMGDVANLFGATSSSPKSIMRKAVTWSVLDARQRQHLELAARLLACAQREFLCKAQWDTLEDSNEALLSSLKIKGPTEDEWIEQDTIVPKDCPIETFVNSPWMHHVLLHMASGVEWQRLLERGKMVLEESPVDTTGMKSSTEVDLEALFPMLSGLKDRPRRHEVSVLSYLPIIGACAELFPAGQCWTSNIFQGWKQLVPKDPLVDDILVSQGCSVQDLSLLVFFLAAFLDEQGGSGGDDSLQMWLLATLIKLTEPTALLYRQFATVLEEMTPLAVSWQMVWKVLFRNDLRYHDSTKVVATNSVGEMVMTLVRDVTQHRCTDPILWIPSRVKDKQSSFLFQNQSQVWNLHAFKNAATLASAVPLELVSCTCHSSSLSDLGNDHIDPASARLLIDQMDTTDSNRMSAVTRRRRLVCFALSALGHHIETSGPKSQELIAAAVVSIITLMRGRMPIKSAGSIIGQKRVESTTVPSNEPYHFTTTPVLRDPRDQCENPGWQDSCIEILWKNDESFTSTSADRTPGARYFDVDVQMRSLYVESVESDATPTTDYVAEMETLQIRNFVLKSIQDRYCGLDSLSDTSYSDREFTISESHGTLTLVPRSLALKVTLSFLLVNFQVGESESLNATLVHAANCLSRLSETKNAKEFIEVASMVLAITRVLVEVLSVNRVNIQATTLERLSHSCTSMLRGYLDRLSKASKIVSTGPKEQRSATFDDDMMDDEYDVDQKGPGAVLPVSPVKSISDANESSSSEDESGNRKRRKRKRNSSLGRTERSKVSRRDFDLPTIPNHACAEKLGELLLFLNPSVQNCELVCRALLGVELDLDPSDLRGDVDLRGGIFCVRLLTSPNLLLHKTGVNRLVDTGEVNDENRDESLVLMVFKILDLIRVNTVPSSPNFDFGYEESSAVHCLNAYGVAASSLSDQESMLLVDILQYEEGIANRPRIRASRMHAATSAFRHAGDKFHEDFDRHFSGIVKLYMTDSDQMIRHLAYIGVNAALESLDQKRALQAIRRLIAPISRPDKGEKKRDQFLDWFRQVGASQLPDDELVSKTEGTDASEAMESDSIHCKAIIAASVSSHDLFLESVFEIIMIPSFRPDLQFMCLRALDKVATMRHYGSMEAMIELEHPGLLSLWVKSDFLSLPLSLTAPDILKRIAHCSGARGWNGHDIDLDGIHLEASLNFISRTRQLLVPLSLLNQVPKIPQSIVKGDNEAQRALEFLAANQKLRFIYSMSTDGEETTTEEGATRKGMSLLLRKHVGDIRAFCFPMLESGDSKYNENARGALQLLHAAVSDEDIKTRTKKKAQAIIRRIVELSSLSGILADVLPPTESPYIDGLYASIDESAPTKYQSGGRHLYLATNAVVNLIRSFAALDKALVPFHKRAMWTSVSLQIKMIMDQKGKEEHKQTQACFCIRALTEAVLKPNLGLLRPAILTSMKNLLEKAMQDFATEKFQSEVCPLMKRLVGASFYVHETCQQELLQQWRVVSGQSQQMLRRSCGLVALGSIESNSDVWGWNDPIENSSIHTEECVETLRKMSGELQQSIQGTYEVLEWVFEHSTSLSLDSLCFVSIAPPYALSASDLETLRSANQSFSAQSLASEHLGRSGCVWSDMPGVVALASELKRNLGNRQAWMTTNGFRPSRKLHVSDQLTLRSLKLDQRIIYSLLVQLERGLGDWGVELTEGFDNEMVDLIRNLAFICSAPCPEELQIAASCCLGKVKAEILVRLPDAVVSSEWFSESRDKDGLLSLVQGKCLATLAELLMSADSAVSMGASETLDALITSKSGHQALTQIENVSLRTFLEPFASFHDSALIGKEKRREAFALSHHEISVLKAKVDLMDESSHSQQNWCWSERLWLSCQSKTLSFEEWVCTLVPAIIVCSLSSEADRTRSPDSEFFWRCQTICSIEHNFAATLFPFLILHLLDVDKEDGGDSATQLVTNTFQIVMRSFVDHGENDLTESTSRKVLILLIDTLDVLRQISQARFLSRKHGRNVIKIKGRTATPKSKDRAAIYNAGLPAPPKWEGVPFGTMLKVDGFQVARACIHIGRYPAALFFLDMNFNARFGKVGRLFEEYSQNSSNRDGFHQPCSDISGAMTRTSAIADSETDKKSILEGMALMSTCYKSMGEADALEAIDTYGSAIKFDSFGWVMQESNNGHGDPIGRLRSMNADSMPITKDQIITGADCMNSLGLHKVVHTYVEGVLANNSLMLTMNEREAQSLREKWYENSLRRYQWEVLDIESTRGKRILCLSQSDDQSVQMERPSARSGAVQERGFFQAVSEALDSYRGDDIESCRSHLNQGRLSVILSLARSGSSESSLFGMVEELDKLRSIQFVEEILTGDDEILQKSLLRPLQEECFSSVLQLMANRLQDSVMGNTRLPLLGPTMWISELGIGSVFGKKCSDGTALRQELFEALVSEMCILSVRSRQLGLPNVASEAIQRLHRLLGAHEHSRIENANPMDQILSLRLEEAKILECRGDFKGAIRTSQQVVDHLVHREQSTEGLEAQMQRLLTDGQVCCGSWLSKYKVQQASSVLESYLLPAAQRAQRLHMSSTSTAEESQRTVRASLALAKVVSNLHIALKARTGSSEWKQSSSTGHLEAELLRCEPLLHEVTMQKHKAKNGTKQQQADSTRIWEELYIYCENLRKDMKRTSAERQSILDSVCEYLELAVSSYSHALSLASTASEDDLSQHVFELISLWFGNHKDPTDEDSKINALMGSAFQEILSFRFVPLANQLFSRIEKSNNRHENEFQNVLHSLVFKMCADHPYHCIVPLLALANGKKVGSGVSGRHASAYIENVGNSKQAPANEIIAKLAQDAAPYVGGLLRSYALLADSYIYLAGADTSTFHKKTTKGISFSKVYKGSSKPLDRCLGSRTAMDYPPAVFTSPPTLQPGANYGDGQEDPIGGERVRGFNPQFSITETGLHRPKIVMCLGTKGSEFRQLVKGEDEIRQDAIMSQVFQFVNSMMRRRGAAETDADRKGNAGSFRHTLRMITYNVIPLSPACGVLEWVEDTASFGEIVIGKGLKSDQFGTHGRYYPLEWNFALCRRHIHESPPTQKRETYDEVCRRFSPSFRFFFMERFGHDMMAWHAARMRYTRSVAISSMVGHILGIGDRHTSNILVHTQTAEVVQIDFGIVFEQGKLLQTPERVPFRLTRNMVDGMGPSGTEGTMVRSSEETIRVLRKNASALLTILSAVVSDPLYKWSVSPVEGMKRQKLESEEDDSQGIAVAAKDAVDNAAVSEDENEMGSKAIAKINDKLQGYEESTSGEQQGIEGQVQLLLHSAQDIDSLCLMYPGWCPFV